MKQVENMADSFGLEIVYNAFKEIKNERNSLQFPEMEDLSNDQLFFLIYGNVSRETIYLPIITHQLIQ